MGSAVAQRVFQEKVISILSGKVALSNSDIRLMAFWRLQLQVLESQRFT